LTLAGLANSHQALMMRVNDPHAKPQVDGAQVQAQTLDVQFGAGVGYVEKTIKITW
jgi:hypothetical protein